MVEKCFENIDDEKVQTDCRAKETHKKKKSKCKNEKQYLSDSIGRKWFRKSRPKDDLPICRFRDNDIEEYQLPTTKAATRLAPTFSPALLARVASKTTLEQSSQSQSSASQSSEE
ncbi:hypothetical protein HAX54_021161 [Datura stramonium]|uniref:Uncharacterized protein n=1 Tax=Datura stramonium TaxID=4076 RepID=A0ABS8US85_DATST|nr:hypothetical protein [Datura stramonium]